VLAPALISLELDPLVAHLFVFYFACLSAITPPVCVAVFMASGIAKADWLKVGVIACLVGLPAFIVPFTFAYNPALILQGAFAEILIAIVTAVLGVVFIDIFVVGYLNGNVNMVERLLLLAGGVMLVIPSIMLAVAGIAMGGLALFSIRKRNMIGRATSFER